MEPWTIIDCGGSTTLQESEYLINIRVDTCSRPGISIVEIDQTIPYDPTPTGSILLKISHIIANVLTCAKRVGKLAACDDLGDLQLHYRDEDEGEAGYRYWYALRGISGFLHFSYSIIPTNELPARGAAPPLDLRAEDDAISGAASTFLIHPPNGNRNVVVRWDLDRFLSNARGMSSIVEECGRLVEMEELDSCYFMAGNIGTYPEVPDNDGFISVWQGVPPYNPVKLLSWAKILYGHYKNFFETGPSSYCIFVRRNKINAGGGVALLDSFVQTYDNTRGNDPEELKLTLAHEMFHTFQPMLSGLTLRDSTAWFAEGSAVFYELMLPFRYKMIDIDTFLKGINFYAGRFYSNMYANIPNDKVSNGFWKDTRIRTIPYDRGFLYFATVDNAMRSSGEGKESLDTLLFEMLKVQGSRVTLTIYDWKSSLRKHLGEQAVIQLDHVLNGSLPLPPSDAFGLQFERVAKNLRRYELGFEPAVLSENPRIVRGVIPDSAACAAGVRNGDVIVNPVPQDEIQGKQDGILELLIARDQKLLTVEYKPRGEVVSAWQWQLKSPQSDEI